jgi:hypothetical protein
LFAAAEMRAARARRRALRAEWARQGAEALDAGERLEEALVEAALANGVDVQRRHDASPAAVLAVTVANIAQAA